MREEMRQGRVLPFRPPAGSAAPLRRPEAFSPLRRRDAASSPIRRREPVVRHLRRHPLLRLARLFLLALALVGGPAAGASWVFRSPAFALSELAVEAEEQGRVSATWVRQALRPAYGRNLPRLPLSWVDERLRRHPWVAATDLRKDLPGRLRVRVIEKQEVALLRRPEGGFPELGAEGAAGPGPAGPGPAGPGPAGPGPEATDAEGSALWYVDADGVRIAPLTAADGAADLLLLSSGSSGYGLRAALELAAEIEAAAPGWARGLSEIEVLGAEDFRVWSADLPFPLLVRSGSVAGKTAYLEALLPQVARRYAGVDSVDLRFARKIILQPSVRSRGQRAAAAPGVHQRGMGG